MAGIANRRAANMIGPDFYPTPNWATEALLAVETFRGPIHEPCCGNGQMAGALTRAGHNVIASDLFDHGFGKVGQDARALSGPVENIVTNMPYNLAGEILPHFLNIARLKVALLLRLSFVESKRRYQMFQSSPPARLYVFPERLSLCAAGETVEGGGTVSYAWFVWDREHVGETFLRWLPLGIKRRV